MFLVARISSACLFMALMVVQVLSHSWLDCVDTAVSAKANFLCRGFPRSYPGRDSNEIDLLYTVRIKNRPFGQNIVPASQENPTYAARFPMAHAKPGQTLILSWETNGHFAKPAGTVVEVHWSQDSSHQLKLYDELSKSTLLASMPFANKDVCQDPSDDNTKCVGSITIPECTASGTYSFIWRWIMDGNPAGEEYLTVFDILIE